ncbi:hypothetical protein ACFOZ0_10155 [Streptomyces yaanensis]|uniref:Uncharacterized protein n=1 Tax=Streptomyces yaanensis TaxID=1142239 RepID=A0ABV7SE29_9ACTN|nr:hypothetical protein [Streptomyces sp. CGMCC 4.7035]WNB96712.1 hypothetical protein Q2K21_00745 [Streptomyces sp. CGMCC 4.7035]
MQWTDENGGAYGEDPYGGVGYAHAYVYEQGGSATLDTTTTAWDPAQLAQGTHPSGETYAVGTAVPTTGTQFHATWPDHATTAWDAPHGDVLTVPSSELDPPGRPVPGPDTPESESVRPVFVDSSGRRQRRVLRAARLLVIPAGGYVALLISAMLGGPTLSAPLVPQSAPTHHPTAPHAAAHESSPGAGPSAGSATSAAAQKTSRPTDRTTAAARPAAASASGPTSTTSPAPAPVATHAAAPSATPKGRAVGSSHKPVK